MPDDAPQQCLRRRRAGTCSQSGTGRSTLRRSCRDAWPCGRSATRRGPSGPSPQPQVLECQLIFTPAFRAAVPDTPVAIQVLIGPVSAITRLQLPRSCMAGVTSLAFSASSPKTLAVGHYDGSVEVFHTALRSATPAARCTAGGGAHAEPVWGLAWVPAAGGVNDSETLVSISTDGRVIQWSVSKVCSTNAPQ